MTDDPNLPGRRQEAPDRPARPRADGTGPDDIGRDPRRFGVAPSSNARFRNPSDAIGQRIPRAQGRQIWAGVSTDG